MRPILLFVLLMEIAVVRADSPPERYLQTALQGPFAAFEGQQRSQVYLESGNTAAMVRVQGDGKGRIRREYQTGAAAGIVSLQTSEAIWQRAGSGGWTRLPRIAEPAPFAVAALKKNYNVTLYPEEKILGRSVVSIRTTPRQKFNPSRRLWLDPKTGIILKDQLFAPDGRMRSSTEFTALSLRPQPPALFQPPSGAGEADMFGPASFSPRRSAAEVERESGRPILLPAHVPPGYRIALYGIMQTGSGRKMPAVRYSDGLAAFTVFQRGWGAGPGMGGGGRGLGRRGRGPGDGACVTQSGLQQSVVMVSGQRSNYLLVGDLAADELERIAKSLP